MPTLDAHQSTKAVKLLNLGNSGAGKTMLIASLARAGYRCFVGDFDNGLDILMDPAVLAPEFRKNVYFKTFTDKMKGQMPDGAPDSIQRYLRALSAWTEGEGPEMQNLGSIYTWTEKDVHILDTLTFLGASAMRWVAMTNGRSGKTPYESDWGEAMRIQESVLETLYSDNVKCNVVVNAHLTVGPDPTQPGVDKAFPSALGKKLPPKVGSYFNTVVYTEKKLVSGKPTFTLSTQARYNMELKNAKPSKVPVEMPADLAQLFAMLKG